ncbi:MAG: HAD family phosphatase [Desulfobacterales bacterium]|nr:HAD family phosphatase [Desulfobacterales bacterium]
MIKTIIFDLGKVILNFDHMLICDGIARYSKYSSNDVCQLGFNSETFELYDRGKIKSEDLFQWILRRFDINISYDMFKSVWSDIFSLNDSVETVLSALKKNGYYLVLVSNTNELHFDFIRENFKVIELFDDLVLSYRIGYSKPHKEIFREALKRAGSSPEDSVYIDDIEEFCKAAEDLGINSILYRSTEQLIKCLEELGVMIG